MHNENDPFSNASHKCCARVFNKTKRYVLFVRFSTKLKQTTNRSKRVNIDCTLYQSRVGCKKNQFKQATLLFRVRTAYNGGKKNHCCASILVITRLKANKSFWIFWRSAEGCWPLPRMNLSMFAGRRTPGYYTHCDATKRETNV